MKRKPPVVQLPNPKSIPQPEERHWHNGGDIEVYFYARSLHDIAKKLIQTLDLEPNPKTAWDASPVILLYRQAIELRMKALVGEGSNFLERKTDPLSLAKTHSLRWLAQIVCQIIKAVRWEDEFKCEGVSSLADFSTTVNELEELDPVAVAIRPGHHCSDGSVPPQLQAPNVVRFARRLDSLLDLLDVTADGLAAAWDLQQEGISIEGELQVGDDFTLTFH